jgi:uncharacterized RDD family membrane protein YckC
VPDEKQDDMRWASLRAYQVPDAPDRTIASFKDRALGFAIDVPIIAGEVVVGATAAGAVASLLLRGDAFETLGGWLGFAAALLAVLYNKVYLVTKRGATIGQRIRRLRVVDARGENLSPGRSLLRALLEIGFLLVPLVPLLDLWIWPVYHGYTLHDKAVGSYVVYRMEVRSCPSLARS